jgi:hypothetical protein
LFAALCALATTVVGFGFCAHSAGGAEHGFRVLTAPAVVNVRDAARDGGGAPPANHIASCDACALTAAPGLGAARIPPLVRAIEISTRVDFASRLGRDLDDSPDDPRFPAPSLTSVSDAWDRRRRFAPIPFCILARVREPVLANRRNEN